MKRRSRDDFAKAQRDAYEKAAKLKDAPKPAAPPKAPPISDEVIL